MEATEATSSSITGAAAAAAASAAASSGAASPAAATAATAVLLDGTELTPQQLGEDVSVQVVQMRFSINMFVCRQV